MNLIVAALATWQIVEIWHHSSLMAPARSIVELWDNKLGELLRCPFCLSVWTALFCTLCLNLTEFGLTSRITECVIYAFAVSRLANLGNDFFHSCNRTPRITFDVDEQNT